jgi:hypothetical protein
VIPGGDNQSAIPVQVNSAEQTLDCTTIEQLLVYYACDEARPEERAGVEQHVCGCANCAALLAVELRLQQMLATMPQSADELDLAGELLARCRSELAEALDDSRDRVALDLQPQGLFARCFAWCRMEMAMHPALGAAFFVLMGLAVGRFMPATAAGGTTQAGLIPTSMTYASPRISDQDLQNMNVLEIYAVPGGAAGGQNVELHLGAMKPIVVTGGPDDSDITRVLSFVMMNPQRYDSDIRMNSVDVLRGRAGDDADIRRVLCSTSLHDPNASVRLRALEALHGSEQDETVRDTYLDALMHDNNPGVRIDAITELRDTLEAGNATADPRIARVLRDLSEHDSNNYIRLQAAAAVRHLSLSPQQ